MDSPERIRDIISRYIPFKVFTVLVYIVWYGSILLWIIALPLTLPIALLYNSILSIVAWVVLTKQGKEVIVISNGKLPDEALMIDLNQLVENRALFLNYEDRRNWRRFSLAVLLFRAFGPSPTPISFLPRYLPSVILVRKLRFPRQFSLGPLVPDRDAKFQNLRAYLTSTSN